MVLIHGLLHEEEVVVDASTNNEHTLICQNQHGKHVQPHPPVRASRRETSLDWFLNVVAREVETRNGL